MNDLQGFTEVSEGIFEKHHEEYDILHNLKGPARFDLTDPEHPKVTYAILGKEFEDEQTFKEKRKAFFKKLYEINALRKVEDTYTTIVDGQIVEVKQYKTSPNKPQQEMRTRPKHTVRTKHANTKKNMRENYLNKAAGSPHEREINTPIQTKPFSNIKKDTPQSKPNTITPRSSRFISLQDLINDR